MKERNKRRQEIEKEKQINKNLISIEISLNIYSITPLSSSLPLELPHCLPTLDRLLATTPITSPFTPPSSSSRRQPLPSLSSSQLSQQPPSPHRPSQTCRSTSTWPMPSQLSNYSLSLMPSPALSSCRQPRRSTLKPLSLIYEATQQDRSQIKKGKSERRKKRIRRGDQFHKRQDSLPLSNFIH